MSAGETVAELARLRAQAAAVRAYADSLYGGPTRLDACGVREKLYELTPMQPPLSAEQARAILERLEMERQATNRAAVLQHLATPYQETT